MPDLPTVSVIVVSWHRPLALRRCLVALAQQDHPNVELCIVADAAALTQARAVMKAAGWTGRFAENPEPNISLARNTGLRMAQGDVVAFIDDDAVPEPTWAGRLAAPFADPRLVTATGFTRGRNGFSFQWRASEVDATGLDHALAVPEGVSLHPGTASRAVKPVGTNCAFRRETLLAVGGFDPAYRFFLEDADIGLRLASHGLTAVVSNAQVHHGFEASARRRADRAPLTLHEIGASSMVFLRRHAAERDWAATLHRLRDEQRQRLLRHMVEGRIEPRDVGRLLKTLEEGISEGGARPLEALAPIVADDLTGFLCLPGTGPRPGRIVAGRVWQKGALAAKARAAVAEGAVTTLFRFSPTALRHRHSFHPDGYWEQSGGLFGAADRREPAFRPWHFGNRLLAETTRWARLRPVPPDPRLSS